MNVSRILHYLLAAMEHAIGATQRVRDMVAVAIARFVAMVQA